MVAVIAAAEVVAAGAAVRLARSAVEAAVDLPHAHSAAVEAAGHLCAPSVVAVGAVDHHRVRSAAVEVAARRPCGPSMAATTAAETAARRSARSVAVTAVAHHRVRSAAAMAAARHR